MKCIYIVLFRSCPIAFFWAATMVQCHGQARSRDVASEQAAVVEITGTVDGIYQSGDAGEAIVQILVRRSEAIRVDVAESRRFPAPGEAVYVHVAPIERRGGIFGQQQRSNLPAAGDRVRAFLAPRPQGTWASAAVSPWFERASDDAPPREARDGTRTAPSSLGMTGRLVGSGSRPGLRVESVSPGGPAFRAGLQIGDVITAVDGARIESVDSLEQAVNESRRGVVTLTVTDVNTGRQAEVEMSLSDSRRPRVGGEATSNGSEADANARPGAQRDADRRSLGIAAERVSLGVRSALKVLRVEPGSPAADAGIEPGDILVKANEIPITGPEQLAEALRTAGAQLVITVRDVRTGNDVPVAVALSAPATIPESTSDGTSTAGAGTTDLGLVTELAFYDVEAAVKITEVAPGSSAARAGLQPGLLILKADGKPILHPDDLTDAARAARGPMRLEVVDPRVGAKRIIEVRLPAPR